MSDGGTWREGDGGTWREGDGGSGGTGLPVEVLGRFDAPVLMSVSGGEGIVFRCDFDRHLGVGPCLLKRYAPGNGVDRGVYERLRSAGRPEGSRLIGLLDEFELGGSQFEVLEWIDGGSLEGLIVSGDAARGLDVVVVELCKAVADFQAAVGGGHFDVKPNNVLVRSLAPLELVLGDLGLARVLGASNRFSRRAGTLPYVPPEATQGWEKISKSLAWDWWSVGMIVAEIALARHPLSLPDGSMPPDEALERSEELSGRVRVDLSGIGDDRVRSLCAGLLTPEATLRWGRTQVQAWLSGESPEVAGNEANLKSRAGQRSSVSVLFAGSEHGDPVALVEAFQANWARAQEQLFQERDPALIDETVALANAHGIDGIHDALAGVAGPADLPRCMARFLITLDPGLHPVFDGIELSHQGLETAALAVANNPQDTATARKLSAVRDSQVLRLWRHVPLMEHATQLETDWNHQLQQLNQLVEDLAYTSTPQERAHAEAWILLAILGTHHKTQLNNHVDQLKIDEPHAPPWWLQLRVNTNTNAHALALATHPTAAATANQTATTHRQIQATQKAEQHAAEAELKRAQEVAYERELAAFRETRHEKLAPLRWICYWAIIQVLAVAAIRYDTSSPDTSLWIMLGGLIVVVASSIGLFWFIFYGFWKSISSLYWLVRNRRPPKPWTSR